MPGALAAWRDGGQSSCKHWQVYCHSDGYESRRHWRLRVGSWAFRVSSLSDGPPGVRWARPNLAGASDPGPLPGRPGKPPACRSRPRCTIKATVTVRAVTVTGTVTHWPRDSRMGPGLRVRAGAQDHHPEAQPLKCQSC